MTGLELLKAPEATAGEIADIISAPCPPTIPAYYHPPVKAIREAAERIREGRMEYAAEALTRPSDPEEPRQP